MSYLYLFSDHYDNNLLDLLHNTLLYLQINKSFEIYRSEIFVSKGTPVYSRGQFWVGFGGNGKDCYILRFFYK